MIKYLILLRFRYIININVDVLHWFPDFLIKKFSGGAASLAPSESLASRNKSAVKNENMSNKEWAEKITQTNY